MATIGRPRSSSSGRAAAALVALAAATFVFVTTETQPIALLDPLGAGLHVSASTVGLLVTAYAVVAGLSAIPLTFASAGARRRPLLLVCAAVLTVSQVAASLAPSYGVLLAARLLCALAHGVFWSIVAPVASSLVAPERAGRATAAAFAGNSLALVAGTPLVSVIGSALGWRAAMAILAAAGALTWVALYVLLPDARSPERPSARSFAGVLRAQRLLVICAITTVVVSAQFVAFTFLAAIVRSDAGVSGGGLGAVLLAYGAAGVLGIAVSGVAADRRPRATMITGCALVGLAQLALLALGAVGGSVPVTVAAAVVWGFAFTGLPVVWQTAVLRAVPRRPDAGSALYVVCFQVGIGGGALLGAVLLASGGVSVVLAASVAFAAAGTGLAAALTGDRAVRRRPGTRLRADAPSQVVHGR